jgi:hypothetical protein
MRPAQKFLRTLFDVAEGDRYYQVIPFNSFPVQRTQRFWLVWNDCLVIGKE